MQFPRGHPLSASASATTHAPHVDRTIPTPDAWLARLIKLVVGAKMLARLWAVREAFHRRILRPD
jgi:hypothetical protein